MAIEKIIETLIEVIKEDVPEFNERVRRYRAELEPDSQHTFPGNDTVCFIHPVEFSQNTGSTAGKSLTKAYTFLLLVGSSTIAPEAIEKLFDQLTGLRFECDQIWFTAVTAKGKFSHWINKLEVWKIGLELRQ